MTKLDFEQGDDVPDRIDVARPGEIDVLGDGEALDWTDEDAAFMADWDAAGSDGGDDEAAVDPFDVLIDRVADSVLDVDDDALRGFFLRLTSQHGFRAAQYRALVAAFASRHVSPAAGVLAFTTSVSSEALYWPPLRCGIGSPAQQPRVAGSLCARRSSPRALRRAVHSAPSKLPLEEPSFRGSRTLAPRV